MKDASFKNMMMIRSDKRNGTVYVSQMIQNWLLKSHMIQGQF
jgi:hypothetical protein